MATVVLVKKAYFDLLNYRRHTQPYGEEIYMLSSGTKAYSRLPSWRRHPSLLGEGIDSCFDEGVFTATKVTKGYPSLSQLKAHSYH